MSQTSRRVLGSLTQDYLWIRTLANQPESKLTEKLNASVKEFRAAGVAEKQSTAPTTLAHGRSSRIARTPPKQGAVRSNNQEWTKAAVHLTEVATQQLAEEALLETKKKIFW
jgi:hypothetical protein